MLTALMKELPGQINSFTTVRKVVKSIADEEKVELPPDPKPEQVKSQEQFTAESKKLAD